MKKQEPTPAVGHSTSSVDPGTEEDDVPLHSFDAAWEVLNSGGSIESVPPQLTLEHSL